MKSRFQRFMDDINELERQKRSYTQMTLGKLISRLKELPKDTLVLNLNEPHSYRGYYSDLALEEHDGTIAVEELIERLEKCVGQTFEGWKGGDFQMRNDTPMWISNEGCCSNIKIMGVEDSGHFVTEQEVLD